MVAYHVASVSGSSSHPARVHGLGVTKSFCTVHDGVDASKWLPIYIGWLEKLFPQYDAVLIGQVLQYVIFGANFIHVRASEVLSTGARHSSSRALYARRRRLSRRCCCGGREAIEIADTRLPPGSAKTAKSLALGQLRYRDRTLKSWRNALPSLPLRFH